MLQLDVLVVFVSLLVGGVVPTAFYVGGGRWKLGFPGDLAGRMKECDGVL